MRRQLLVHFFSTPPLIFYLYPVVAGLLARSEVPTIFNRYSPSLFVFNAWNLALCALAVRTLVSDKYLLRQCVYLLIIFTSLLVPGNNQLRQLPFISGILPLVRLSAALAMLYGEFDRFRKRANYRFFIALGSGFLFLSIVDLGLLGWVSIVRPESLFMESKVRGHYDLSGISERDIILIGDSFVWGSGVSEKDSFGNVLERLYDEEGKRIRVYSLGARGASINGYIRLLKSVPESIKGSRVILSFYMNDMPPAPSISKRLRQSIANLGHGSLVLRLFSDYLARRLTPDVDQYNREIVRSFKVDADGFSKRWAVLKETVQEFRDLARLRSRRRPVFLIIPIMVDFESYPLVESHVRLGLLAEDLGFDVIDLFPVFRRVLGDGRKYTITGNDNHFNSYVHHLVAQRIKEVLDQLE